MDTTIMEINAKSTYFEDKIREIKEPKELPKRYLSDFKNSINQIKTTQYDLPKRIDRETEREREKVVKEEVVNEPLSTRVGDVFLEQENKPSKKLSSNSGNYLDEIDNLRQQLVNKDVERQDLIDEFQIKQSRLVNQLKDIELTKNQQIAQFENEKEQYLLEINHLKSLNQTLKSTYNQLNDDLNELNEFRSKSIDKFIQLKLQIKLQQDEIMQLKQSKERVIEQEVPSLVIEPISEQEDDKFEKLPNDNTTDLLKVVAPDIPDGTTTQLIKGTLPRPSSV